MKRAIVVLSVIGLVIGAFAFGRAGAQEGVDEMAEWMALAKTGPEHEALLKGVGTWTCESKSWMAPDKPPMVSKGKCVRTAALGNRFVREDFEGEMMGQPFQGIGYVGFNNATRKYESIWFDSMGTGIMYATGTETEKDTFTFTGSFFGPGGKEVKSRLILKKTGDDQSTMEMYNNDGRGEMKCMEMTYTRAK